MEGHKCVDIQQRLAHNRRQLAIIIASVSLLVMTCSGTAIYLVHRISQPAISLWILLALFWPCCLIFAALRYSIGCKKFFRYLQTMASSQSDFRLTDALEDAVLASGAPEKIRLLVIPDTSINTFSIYLPDRSYLVFATKGVAERLSQRERQAIMAHETAHIRSGDTLVHSAIIRIIGYRALRRLIRGIDYERYSFLGFGIAALILFVLGVTIILLSFLGSASGFGSVLSSAIKENSVSANILGFIYLFLIFVAVLPFLMDSCLRFAIDGECEYSADLQAAYYIRDPAAMWQAIKMAAGDLYDVLILPSHLDSLLFHPVANLVTFEPFQTQPSMLERMNHFQQAFPQIVV